MFGRIFSLGRTARAESRDGSSRRGKRYVSSDRDEPSVGARTENSSTHSAGGVLFDLELSHRGSVEARDSSVRALEGRGDRSASGRPAASTLQRVVYLGQPVMDFEMELLQDVKAARPRCSGSGKLLDLPLLLRALRARGYDCALATSSPAHTHGSGQLDQGCLEKLRHTFLLCFGRIDGSFRHNCVVDPRLREQFHVGHPTPAYSLLLKAVPLEFVGSTLRLHALVALLCEAIAEAYLRQGLPLPPWRKTEAMLTKWQARPELEWPSDKEEVQQQGSDARKAEERRQRQQQREEASAERRRQRREAAAGPSASPAPTPAPAAPAAERPAAAGGLSTAPAARPQQQQQPEQQQPAPPDRTVAQMPPGAGDPGIAPGAKWVQSGPQHDSSWADLSTIIETQSTRSAQSSPSPAAHNKEGQPAPPAQPATVSGWDAGAAAEVEARVAHSEGGSSAAGSEGTRRVPVSMLARGIKGEGGATAQCPSWMALLPGVRSVKRMGPSARSQPS